MKKTLSIVVGALALVAAVINGYLLFFKSDKATETVAPASSAPSQAISSSEAVASSSETATSSSEVVAEAGQYTDGTYTGVVTSTNRGDYQVQVTIAEGKMADIQVILFPDGNEMSQQINGTNLPIYTAEALEKQSAEVSQISGASEAFKGFTGSLQDALNQAKG